MLVRLCFEYMDQKSWLNSKESRQPSTRSNKQRLNSNQLLMIKINVNSIFFAKHLFLIPYYIHIHIPFCLIINSDNFLKQKKKKEEKDLKKIFISNLRCVHKKIFPPPKLIGNFFRWQKRVTVALLDHPYVILQ